MTRVTPIRFTRDVRTSTDFYVLLGLGERAQETSRTWSSLMGSGGGLGLHIAAKATTEEHADAVALQLTTDSIALDVLHERVRSAGHRPTQITDETFGRFFTVRDPDGYLVQVNETPEEFSRSYETEQSIALLKE